MGNELAVARQMAIGDFLQLYRSQTTGHNLRFKKQLS